jgi:hypothetical protein
MLTSTSAPASYALHSATLQSNILHPFRVQALQPCFFQLTVLQLLGAQPSITAELVSRMPNLKTLLLYDTELSADAAAALRNVTCLDLDRGFHLSAAQVCLGQVVASLSYGHAEAQLWHRQQD